MRAKPSALTVNNVTRDEGGRGLPLKRSMIADVGRPPTQRIGGRPANSFGGPHPVRGSECG